MVWTSNELMNGDCMRSRAGDLIYSCCVTATFKGSIHENVHHFFRIPFSYESCRNANNVGVVMFAGKFGQFFTPANRGPDALVFVGRNSNAIGATAKKNAK